MVCCNLSHFDLWLVLVVHLNSLVTGCIIYIDLGNTLNINTYKDVFVILNTIISFSSVAQEPSHSVRCHWYPC